MRNHIIVDAVVQGSTHRSDDAFGTIKKSNVKIQKIFQKWHIEKNKREMVFDKLKWFATQMMPEIQ